MPIEQDTETEEESMSETEATEVEESDTEKTEEVEAVEEKEVEEDEEEEVEEEESEEPTRSVSHGTDSQAIVTGTVNQIQRILNETSLGFHDDMYVNIKEDGIMRLIAGSPGDVVVMYSDYTEGAVEKITGSTEAMIEVSKILDVLNLIGDRNSEVTLRFEGTETERLAQRLRIEGQLESGMVLPGGESILDRMPLELPQMFTEEDRLVNANTGDPAKTHVETYVSTLSKIDEVVDMRDELKDYPFVIKDGQVRLDVGNRNQNYIAGDLPGTVVEGEDVNNVYGEGLEKIADALSGEIDIYTEQGAPICVVKRRSHGCVRHVVGPAEE